MQRNPSSDFPSREDLLWLPGGPQFIPDTERSTSYERVYHMASGYGEGTLRTVQTRKVLGFPVVLGTALENGKQKNMVVIS